MSKQLKCAGAPLQIRPERPWYYLDFSEQNAVSPISNRGQIMPTLLLLVPPPRFLDLPPFLNIDMVEIKNNNKNQKNCFRKCRQNQELLNPCSRQSSGYLIRELWYFQNLPKRPRNFIQDFSMIINFIQDFSIFSNGLTYSICSLT